MSPSGTVQFSIADRYFFDVPDRLGDESLVFDACLRATPSGWMRQPVGLCVSMRPDGVALPQQGWKIHVSATPATAAEAIDVVSDYCLSRYVAFKFVRSPTAVALINSKSWPRSSSGKVVTIYPSCERQFEKTLCELDSFLSGNEGPYILGDIRYANGPLYVRYGGFGYRWCLDEDGLRTPAISTPDGRLIPDSRLPVFTVPEFAPVPAAIARYVSDPPGRVDEFPYDFERVLHYSNAGGVYLGSSEIHGRVVLREARPHAGLDGNVRDAVTRLRHEYDVLSRLQGLGCVPEIIEYITAWEHHYLVMEYIDGRTLLDEIIQRYPLVHPEPEPGATAGYVEWALQVGQKVALAVSEIASRGVRVKDLHPGNIILRRSGELAIVDFECASALDDETPASLGAPGFIPPAHLSGDLAERYLIDSLRLMLLLPAVQVISLDPAKAQTLVQAACSNLPVPTGHRRELEHGLRVMGPDAAASPDRASQMFEGQSLDWPSIRESLIMAIQATATPTRTDRLFPGDPLQFAYGGGTVAYGAAGVLLALHLAGEDLPSPYIEWLIRAGLPGAACNGDGLYDGLHGIAYTLDLLGARDAALDVLSRAPSGVRVRSQGLFGGRAGIALNYLHFAEIRGDESLRSAAVTLGSELVGEICGANASGRTGRPGLFHGATGIALLFLHLFECCGESRFLEAAEVALRLDLSDGVMLPDGTYHLRAGSRRLLYLDGGSVGVGLVLARYLQHRQSTDLSSTLEAIRRGCNAPFVLQPGLFQGRAGLIAGLCNSSGGNSESEVVTKQVRRLGWHAIWHESGLAFPGSGLTRLSCDLATGSSGILLALRCAFEGSDLGLPFLTEKISSSS